MGHACVVGAGGAVCAPPGDAPAGGAPAVLDGLAALPVVVARAGQQTCPMPLIGEKQEGHKKRNSEYREWGGRG